MEVVGIYLEGRREGPISPQLFEAAYHTLEKILSRHNVPISHYALSSSDQKRKHYKKYGSAWHRQRLERGFTGIDMVGFCAASGDSDAPAYDWFAMANFSHAGKYVSAEILIDRKYVELDSAALRASLTSLIKLTRWEFGWGLQRCRSKDPHLFLSGMATGRFIDKWEERNINLWYACHDPDVRRRHLRDVFHLNIINEDLLAQPVGISDFKAFILDDVSSTLERLDDDLWLWTVDAGQETVIRRKLRDEPILISKHASLD